MDLIVGIIIQTSKVETQNIYLIKEGVVISQQEGKEHFWDYTANVVVNLEESSSVMRISIPLIGSFA